MTEITDEYDKQAAAFRTAMRHDRLDVTMLHFGLPPQVVQALTPYPVHTHPGDDPDGPPLAWITLVMFELRRMRIPLGRCPVAEPITRALLRPISDHRFVNLRTYVRHRGRPGIYFIAEWLNNRLAVALGPATFGLPYRFAPVIAPRRVVAREGTLAWQIDDPTDATNTQPTAGACSGGAPAAPGTIDHFLLERYTAFTRLRGKPRCFHIRHEPWPIRRVDARLTQDGLVRHATGDWLDHTQQALTHQSPGVVNVEVSRPFRAAAPPATTITGVRQTPAVHTRAPRTRAA